MKYAVYSQPVEVRHKLPPLGSLTAIRFVAAMHVVLFHESHWTGHIVFFPLAARIVNSGYTSVTLFFVLSGFILAYNYERVRSRRDFWVARFARIYPVYFLSLLPPLLITPHWSYHPHPGPLGLALTFCLLQAWWPPLAFSLNQAAWTLSVEALFYASFPFLLPWIQGLRRQTFILLQMAYLLLLCLPALMGLKVSTASAGFQFAVWLEGTFPLVRLDAFVLGVYAGVHFRRSVAGHQNLNQNKTHGSRSGGYKVWRLLVLAGCSLALLAASPSVLLLPVRTGMLQICYTLWIFQLAGVQWAILNNHVSQMAGEISYGVYILQFPVLFAFDDFAGRLFPKATHISQIYLVVLVCVAYVIFRWFEVPVRLFIRQLVSGHAVPVRPI